MPHQVTRLAVRYPRTAAAAVLAWLVVLSYGLYLLLVAAFGTPAQAQTAPIQVTQFPGATVELPARPMVATRTLVTACPDGAFAIAGGWDVDGTAAYSITESYPSRLPGGGGGGAWTLTVRKDGPVPAALVVTPYVTCLLGAAQLPE